MEVRKTGIAEGVLVHTSQGGCSTHQLAPGDKVWSFDNESRQWRLTSIRTVVVQSVKADMSYLRVGSTLLRLGSRQLVWVDNLSSPSSLFGKSADGEPVTESGCWVQARNLFPGDRVLSLIGAIMVEGNSLREGEMACVAELETSELHNYAVGSYGILIHNRNPALAAGQTHNVTVQATQTQQALTLPPIDQDHIFLGSLRLGIPALDGLHHFTAAFAIQQGVAITVPGHIIREQNPAGGLVSRVVNLQITPLLTTSEDAPFDARIRVIDPGSNMVLATKNRSTLFPLNWTRAQVIQAIYEGLVNYVVATGLPPIGAGLRSTTDAGVRMSLHVSSHAGVPAQVYSGYPLGAQPLVTAAEGPQ